MESIALVKGYVHLMEDRIVVENDNALARKRKNVLLNALFMGLLLVYAYYSYRQYLHDPHTFNLTGTLLRMLFFLFAILPGMVRAIRFSTTDEIPYTSIKRCEPNATLFNWNSGINLHLLDNKIRTLWLDKEEMKEFSFQLNRKLETNSPGL